AGDWRGIQGNFGPPGEVIDVKGLSTFATLEEMLADPDIDLIDICLPPHLHKDAVTKSLNAGKWVLCEKPLALTAAEAHALASQAAGKLLVAHILPFFAEYKLLCDAAGDGRFGKLMGGRFKRVIGPPSWIPDFYDPARVGGPLVDLHVHDAHLMRMLLGMPQSVHTSRRVHSAPGQSAAVPQYVESIFHFDDPAIVASAVSGVIDQPSRGFTHGYDVQFEKANVQFEMAAFADGSVSQMPLTIAHQDGTVERPVSDSGDAIAVFVEEVDAAARAVAGGAVHPALDAFVAADAIAICEMQN
ncbi:MAG: Gfo/Idh/MocA family protein, partial [Planctomycetaceae bacterium]